MIATVSPRDIVNGVWQPGMAGAYDRVSAMLDSLGQRGIGRPGETRATAEARAAKIEQILVSYARETANDFMSYSFVDSNTGRPMRQGRMHQQEQAAFDSHDNVAIGAYRGSGKTTQAIGRAVWEIGRDHNLIGKVLTAGSDISTDRVREVKNQIERNARVKVVFPDLRPQPGMPWTDSAFTVARDVVTKDPTLMGGGIESSDIGHRCKFILADDTTPPESMSSPTVRHRSIENYENIWMKMLFPGKSWVWFIYTPWHELDLTSKIAKNAAYRQMKFAVGGPDGCRSCPDCGGQPCGIPFHNPWAGHHVTPGDLQRIYLRDGSLSYSRSHLLIPLASELSLFPDSLFYGDVKRSDLLMGLPWRWWAARGIRRVIGVDLALSAETGADYFVIFVLGFDDRGRRFVVDILREKGCAYSRQLDAVSQACAKYLPDLVYIEGTQYQRVFTDTLQAQTGWPIRAFYPLGRGKGRRVEGAEKKDLKFGVPSLRIHLETHRYFIPYGDEGSRDKADIYIDELKHFALDDSGKMQGLGAHDDTVTSGWIADCAAMKLGAGILDVDAEEDLKGIEDNALRSLGMPAEKVQLDATAGLISPYATAVQSQVPATAKPRPADYLEIYTALTELPSKVQAQLVAYGAFHDALREAPSLPALLQAGFPPQLCGVLSGLLRRHGAASVRWVVEDVVRQSQIAGSAVCLEGLDEALDAEEYLQEGIHSGLDEDGLGPLHLVPGATFEAM